MKNILVVCTTPRDISELPRLSHLSEYSFIFHELTTDYLEKFIQEDGSEEGKRENILQIIDDIVRTYKNKNISGIINSDDYPGAAVANIVAQRLNIPGTPPEKVLLCQHKYYARCEQQKVVPEAVPQFCIVPPGNSMSPINLPFPLFAKPVKCSFSYAAQKVESKDQLSHIKFPSLLFLEPFNELIKEFTSFEYSANYWLLEGLLEGLQVTLDGYVFEGNVVILGITDSIMFPGTICFKSFEYPSSLPLSAQEKMHDIAIRCMRGIGYEHGLFNIEFFYNPATQDVHIIEINPRFSNQFADLYEKVDGINTYELAVYLACGKRPSTKIKKGKFNIAASCVLREFENKYVQKVPTQEEIKGIKDLFPESRIEIFAEEGKKLSHTLQDGKSYRYGLIHLGADDHHDLEQRFEHCKSLLPIELTSI